MPPGIKLTKNYLDGEHCARTWINCGSIGKTVKILVSEGVVNPNSGKAPTDMGVWGSAWMWILENLPEAKKLIADSWRANGELLTEEKWCKLIAGKARRLLSNRQYEAFMEKHLYLKPYAGK